MKIEPLPIRDSWLLTPQVHRDERGSFLEWYRADVIEAETGRALVVRQANHSVSERGVIRGIHFADVPPGQAKYVYCAAGEILDVVVDLRAGSPTFGQHAAVRLNSTSCQSVLIAEGLGHAFCALSETAEVVYLVTTTYDPAAEHTLSAFDADLALPWNGGDYRLSPRDAKAETLSEAMQTAILPSYEVCREHYATLEVR